MNEDSNHPCITSMDGAHIKEVEDFKYLGSYVADSRKDFLARMPATNFSKFGSLIFQPRPRSLSSGPVLKVFYYMVLRHGL